MDSELRGTKVAVVGGGNAALCAALTARDAGAAVTVFERAPKPFRGGNTRHTRNIRTLHSAADDYVTGPYLIDEFYKDLQGVSGDRLNLEMATLTIKESESICDWMVRHGVRWQAPLRGTLSLSRTNHFFLGGGKSLLNAYYRTAKDAGIVTHYQAEVVDFEMEGNRCTNLSVSFEGDEPISIAVDAVVAAAGGFEANRDWLHDGWGEAADTLIVRGTPYNDGKVLRLLMDADAATIGDPRGAHAIAVDARAPAYDAGILSRLDAIPLGIVVNRDGQRFSDEGADLWPKRYASWGRLVAEQPESIAFVIYDVNSAGESIPGMYPPITSDTIEGLAAKLGLDQVRLRRTVDTFNGACRPGCRGDMAALDDCGTVQLEPPKSHWAKPIDAAPFFGYPLRPGITFTYMGLAVNARAFVRRRGGGTFDNVFAAGEIMAGNILTQGYLAGFGMTIGSVWGRIAGREAAKCSNSL